VPYKCTATTLVFSIRTLANSSEQYNAILYVNGAPTGLIAQIADGSVSFNSSASGSISLNMFDLISVKLDFSKGSLPKGVTCTLIIS
jgi:hypothetical protein